MTSNSNGVIIVSDRVIKHARVNHTPVSYTHLDVYKRQNVTLLKGVTGRYVISHEALFTKKATSRSDAMHTIFEVEDVYKRQV